MDRRRLSGTVTLTAGYHRFRTEYFEYDSYRRHHRLLYPGWGQQTGYSPPSVLSLFGYEPATSTMSATWTGLPEGNYTLKLLSKLQRLPRCRR